MPRKKTAPSSAEYRIFETSEYRRRLDKLGATARAFIEAKLRSTAYPRLRLEPHFGTNIRKLVDHHPETWRYRLGRFRLFYSIDSAARIVYILTVDWRTDAY
jgi:mRNA interferase RelE/StbE